MSEPTPISHIKFGIPTLDNLFLGNERRDIAGGGIVLPQVGDSTERTSVCIVGPDGSGKSLFALHLVSRYAADVALNLKQNPGAAVPHVLFISTDFSYARAVSAWNNFDLNHPYGRKIPFESLLEPNQRRSPEELRNFALKVDLKQYSPLASPATADAVGEPQPIAEALADPNGAHAVVKFIDVAMSSSGDDWAFVSRLLSLLPRVEKNAPSHMLVIDAVEGFETLVGDVDLFGVRQPRRARIAQIVRLAARKCHVVFVAEEPEDNPSIPEQFVADVVLRLRSEETQGTTRHSLEIEKARGQRHALGRQPYFIRDGSGSSTGSERNLDDPRIFDGKKVEAVNGNKEETFDPYAEEIFRAGFDTHLLTGNFQGYIHVTHSIHQRSREILELDRETGFPALDRVARFGIDNLDSLLVEQNDRVRAQGLPLNRLSALIGEAGTHKSDLGLVWIGQAFQDYGLMLLGLAGLLLKTDLSVPDFNSELRSKKWLPASAMKLVSDCRKWVDDPPKELTDKEYARFEPWNGGAVVTSTAIDPAFFFLYRFRDLRKSINRVGNEKNRRRRALAVANILLRYRYGLTCAKIRDGFQDEGVAVLLSTRDDTSDIVAEKICERLLRKLQHQWEHDLANDGVVDEGAKDLLKKLLQNHIRRRLIVRRLEIHNATPEGVFHIIESLVHAGRRVLLGDVPYQLRFPDSQNPEERKKIDRQRRRYEGECFKASGRIRFLLDDFSSFRDSYPDLRNDSVFLPFLVFWLGRMGVTGLIVCTGDGQPTREVEDPVEVQLRALVAQRLQTWRVAFHGTQRVAITAIPSPHWNKPSPIRELILSNEDLGIQVSREFELHANLGHSKPERVPLEIRFFSHTAAAEAFIAEENKVFRAVFGTQSPSDPQITEPGAILWGAKTEDYDVLRDFCHIQGGSRLDRTILIQVDEYWLAGRRSNRGGVPAVLRDLSGYRDRPLQGSEPPEDFYGVFNHGNEGQSRINHFKSIDSDGNLVDPHVPPDRMPFTWDFGFLMCDRKAWIEALDEYLPAFGSSTVDSDDRPTVGSVWERLPGAASPRSRRALFQGKGENEGQVGWSDFLMAAAEVARVRSLRTGKPVAAFDFSRMSKGTIVCLILEVWASEIYKWLPKERRARFLRGLGEPAGTKKDKAAGLADWFAEYRVEFYMSMILLSEVIRPEDIIDPANPFEIRTGGPIKNSVAVRHWYSTACNHADDVDLTPVGLPGHFSVRGDWYLAVAEGSRSDLLAERALDLLSSRRSNVMRMQLGMGLATRSLGTPDRYRTRLSWYESKQAAGHRAQPSDFVRRFVNHKEIAGLGACGLEGDRAFSWLWRSSLRDFDEQSRVVRKWLMSAFQRWYEHESYLGHNWVRGFELYSFLSEHRKKNPGLSGKDLWKTLEGEVWKGRLQPDGKLRTWEDINEMCDALIQFLTIASKEGSNNLE